MKTRKKESEVPTYVGMWDENGSGTVGLAELDNWKYKLPEQGSFFHLFIDFTGYSNKGSNYESFQGRTKDIFGDANIVGQRNEDVMEFTKQYSIEAMKNRASNYLIRYKGIRKQSFSKNEKLEEELVAGIYEKAGVSPKLFIMKKVKFE